MQLDASETEEHHGHQRLRTMKAVRSPRDHPHPRVHPFDNAVRQPLPRIRYDSLKVGSDRPRRFHHWLQLRPRCPRQPRQQLHLQVDRLPLVQCVGQRFLQQVGAVQPEVRSLNVTQLLEVTRRELPVALQECVSRAFDALRHERVLFRSNLRPSNLVDRVGDQALDMESVVDDLRVRQPIRHGAPVGRGHVDRHRLDPLSTFLAQFLEERPQRVSAPSLPGPDHSLAVVVDDDGHVGVPLAVAELIDPDPAHASQTIRIQPFTHNALDNVPDRPPGDSNLLRDRRSIHDLRQVRDEFFERVREPASMGGPGNRLGLDPALPAEHPPRSVLEPGSRFSETQVPPVPGRLATVPHANGTALAAAGLSPTRADSQHQASILEKNCPNEKVDDTDKSTEYRSHAHGILPVLQWWFATHRRTRIPSLLKPFHRRSRAHPFPDSRFPPKPPPAGSGAVWVGICPRWHQQQLPESLKST